MRVHTNGLKNELKEVKEQDYKVSYGTTVISGNALKNFNPVVNSDLLKSVMKEFYFETSKSIEKGTVVNAKQGILVNNNYEYIDYGDYIIKESEYNPNSKTYSYKCYDYMLKTMIDYKKLNITYPITIKDYIKAICTYCGLEFASYNNDFVNSTKTIKEDYFDNGKNTFRDILDYLAQLVSGWICIDKNNKVEVRYTNETNENFDEDYIRNINVDFTKKYGPVNSVVFSRGDGSDNIYRKDDNSIAQNGLCEIKISDNPFLEDSDRDTFIDGVFNKLKGLEFYILDVDTVGILFLEVGDLYNFNIGFIRSNALKSGVVKSGLRKSQSDDSKPQNSYKCLLLNSEIKTIDGLTETQYVEEPQTSTTDYKTSAPTDNSVKNAIIQTNKNSAEILLKVNSDKVISAINLSPEQITIDTSKLDIDAIATFTNSKLADAGSTIINGANITTGTISADRLDSKVITTDNFSAQNINADKITAGTLSAASVKLKNVSLTPTSSTIGGLTVQNSAITSDRAALYAGTGVLQIFNEDGGSMILSNAARLCATAGVGVYSNSNGQLKAPSKNIDLKACNGAEVYLGCMETVDGLNEKSSINCKNGELWLKSSGPIYANKQIVVSSSSLATKENIVDLKKEQKQEVYNLIKNIPLKQYDYKKQYGKPFNYGFIIEDIENTKLKNLLHIEQLDINSDIKTYSTEDLVRLQLITIQELMNKIEKLENEIKEMKLNGKN